MSLVAGDRVTVDWASTTDSNGGPYAPTLYVYPAGTTDYSINNLNPLDEFGIGSNEKAESTFVANKSGSFPSSSSGPIATAAAPRWPLQFHRPCTTRARADGKPWHHEPLARAHHTPLPHSGKLVLFAHLADGTAVSGGLTATASGSWASKWHPIGTATATAGKLVLAYRLPASVHG